MAGKNQSRTGCRPGFLRRGLLLSLFLLAWSAPGQAALHPREPLPEYRLQVFSRTLVDSQRGIRLKFPPLKLVSRTTEK